MLNNDGVLVQRYFTFFPLLFHLKRYLSILIHKSKCRIYDFKIAYVFRGREITHEVFKHFFGLDSDMSLN